MPKTILGRSAELVKLAARIGSEEIKGRLSSLANEMGATQLEQMKILVDSLGRLKGAAMKVGQLLSMDFADHFPPEVRAVLEQLQSTSPHFLPFAAIEAIVRKELGPYFERLSDISVEPIAAASIGQVHTAQYNGKKIVLKIQYPGVADSIDSDINLLRTVVRTLVKLSLRKIDIDPLFAELKDVFTAETNYLNEIENLKEYRGKFKGNANYRIPVPVEELSSAKVLAMSFEEGTPLKDWIRGPHAEEDKIQIGKKILDLYFLEYFANGMVQSDPNPANFLVTKSLELVLLDLGAVKRFSPEFIREYVKLMEFTQARDAGRTAQQAVDMGFIDAREKPETKAGFYDMLRSSLCAFDLDRQPFDFSDKDYFTRTRTTSSAFGKQSKFSAPPFAIIFLHRKLVGIFGLLKDLHVKLDLTPYWERATQLGSYGQLPR